MTTAGRSVRLDLSPEQAWQDSGLAGLCGPANGPPLRCDLPLASHADGVMQALNALLPAERRIAWLGRRLLGIRRLTHPLRRQGAVAPGGSCRLLACADGWLAVNLAREDDWAMLPAWLEAEGVSDWSAVAAAMRARSCASLLERARWLGLPVALDQLPQQPAPAWYQLEAGGTPRGGASPSAPRVLDLTALWAGPLCTQLLRQAGAQVCKIEHPGRPDGARNGPPGFFHALNAGKDELSLDLAQDSDRARFLAEVARADIVVEAFRPRALRQLGIDAQSLVQQHPGLSWVSITGYGRSDPEADWVAFGDDAAVAAGLSALIHQRSGERVICGDAIADPLTGLHAALVAWASYSGGGGHLISVPMRNVVAHCLQ